MKLLFKNNGYQPSRYNSRRVEKVVLAWLLVIMSPIGNCCARSIHGSWQSRSKISQLQQKPQQRQELGSISSHSCRKDVLFGIRGGVSKTSKNRSKKASRSATGKPKVGSASSEKKSLRTTALVKYKSILPLTRVYITMVGAVTLLSMLLGEEGQVLLALDPIRMIYGLELWRPLTAAAFLGPPSIGWLMSAYYLFEYGSSLERAFGTAQHFVFLFGQIACLTLLCSLMHIPFFGQPLITAMLHVLSRSMPHQKVKWLIFTVPYWTLPYGLMASDVLQAGSPTAAVPHVLGILSGHFYFFHKFVWPKLGGEDWWRAPDFLLRRLDPDAAGLQEKKTGKGGAKKKGKGRKLA